MRAAGIEPVDWADAGGGRCGDRSGGPRPGVAAAGRGGRPGAGAARRRRWRRRGRPGSATCPPPGSTATGRAAGSTRRAPLAPANERGRWRVAAEAAWQASGLPVHVFRLAGIYGPGRSAFDRLRAGSGAAGGEAGAGLQPHPRRRPGGGPARLDGAPGAGAGLQRRRRRAGAAAGRDRLRRGPARHAGCRRRCRWTPRSSRRWRGASTRESKRVANRRIKRGARRAARSIRTIAPDCGRSSPPAAEGRAATAGGKPAGESLSRLAFAARHRPRIRAKSQ